MKTIKITFIGTTGSIASKERGYPAILINEDLLLDCGDGTTQKLVKIGKIDGINTICITHLHCDHYTGLFTLLWHYWINKRKEKLTIIGPRGIKEAAEIIIKLINTPESLRTCELEYIELLDIDKVQEIEEMNGEYLIKCIKTNHVPLTIAFRIEYNGKSLLYSSDTEPCEDLLKISDKCDLIIHETTFPDEFSELAHELHHSTPSDAARLAKTSNASKLALNHISSIYQDEVEKFRKQAQTIFNKEVIIAKDLMNLEI